ncbi:hypothetical protein [Paenarthrobacter aurescens]|uniref:hypothetical protein n=1 Tax=Paenarthrobacter aurescens TaxID=43663 RepID=UPI0021C102A7|nr:hypothetical protein [Paenarthrobacter aurescens]MCT9868335.1 hypothetical protein [Paenarthrobacter aurescens]
MSELRVGDNLPLEMLSFSAVGCPVWSGQHELEEMCALDAGHTGQHIAIDAAMVVRAVWE